MYNVLLLNKISKVGLNCFTDDYTYSEDMKNPEAVLVRSASMHDMELPESLLAIARAGAGVNNIPLDKCSEKGICVFNTPGANANAVKELVICGLLISSRKVVKGAKWAETLKGSGSEVGKLVEKGKSSFAGPEIKGKTLGIVGMGAIGMLVAHAAEALGMSIIGYDPYLSEQGKSKMSPTMKFTENLDDIYAVADYITLHVPLNDGTRGMIGKESLAKMKDGVRILNFSRDGLVVSGDILEALESGKMAAYVTDFATDDIIGAEGVTALPHLGASTPESEENCAYMAAKQVMEYLENGNIVNSVNLPNISVERSGKRVCVVHKACDELGAKLAQMGKAVTKTRGDYAYTIIDNAENADPEAIKAMPGVLKVRSL
ncbi:MAG: 3-phosphoglycerate dehydrogenase [Clostridiales bacterium]|nr:3-phosphoglycerate dehydrogenase [Clostridiales bacterium]